MVQGVNNNALSEWLALFHITQNNPKLFHKINAKFSELKEFFKLSTHELEKLGLPTVIIQQVINPPWQLVEQDLQWQEQPQQTIVSYQDAAYPALLKEISDPPPVLFVAGDKTVLQTHQLAIVGSRNPTKNGFDTAYEFAYHLGQNGLTITSGLALGIDAASHQGCIHAKANTIAVMGTGLKHIYPAKHQHLAEQISQHGALVSEFPLDTLPKATNFPRRNRVISGMSVGVLIVEAALRSGSLITANFALEYNREVFAIPGSIHNPLARGCHALIRQGAKLVETVKDIAEELSNVLELSILLPLPKKQISRQKVLNPEEAKFLKHLTYDTVTIDSLTQQTGLTVSKVSALLTQLKLQGFVVDVPGGFTKTLHV